MSPARTPGEPITVKVERVVGWWQVCAVCGLDFVTGRRVETRTCSATCRWADKHGYGKKGKRPKPRAITVEVDKLVGWRHTCAVCGGEFVAGRVGRRTCTRKCDKAFRRGAARREKGESD